MEPQPETDTALVCGAALSVTAEELDLAGVEVKDPAAFTALSQVVNLQKITLSKITFADAGWDGLLTGIKAGARLTHLSLTACDLGPKHTADLADIFSSSCSIDTLCLAKNDALTGKRSRDITTTALPGFTARKWRAGSLCAQRYPTR